MPPKPKPKKKLNTATPLTIAAIPAQTFSGVYIGRVEYRQRPGAPGVLTVRLFPANESAGAVTVSEANPREITITGIAAKAEASTSGLEADFLRALEALVEAHETATL